MAGVKYTWDGEGWRDEQFVRPPKLIVGGLNRKLEVLISAEDLKTTNVKLLLIRARQARENLQYDRAEKLARKSIELDPENHAGAAVLCATLRARGKPLEALEQTNRFIFSKHAPLLTTRAAAYCDLRMWEQAKKTIGKALAIKESKEAFMVVKRIKSVRPELYRR